MWFKSKAAANRICSDANSRRDHDEWRYIVIKTAQGWQVSLKLTYATPRRAPYDRVLDL